MAELCQLPWPISVGLWYVGSKGGDRFTSGYREAIPVPERIEQIAKMRGVKGIELHVPYEVTDETFEEVRKSAKDAGLKIVTVVPGLWNEARFKDGVLISYDKKIRKEGIERIKKALEMTEELRQNDEGGYFAIYWPAADGVTYSFDSYHPERRKMMQDGLIECLQSTKGVIALEHKPADPATKTYCGTTGEAILMCRDIRAVLGKGNEHRIGINPEMAHLLMADANLGEEVSRILEEGMLFHTHWNTIKRRGADTDMMVGTDNWNESAEVLFWLDEFKYDKWFGIDLFPKSEDPASAVDVSITALERMYVEVMSVKEKIKPNMRDPNIDATHTQKLLLQVRGAKYKPLA